MKKNSSLKSAFFKALDKFEQNFVNSAEDSAPENPSASKPEASSIKARFTRAIIDDGNSLILEKAISKYKANSKSKDLGYLLKDNHELAQWLVESADLELLSKLPIEFRELIDSQLEQ